MEDEEKPGSQPLRGVDRVEETWSPSQLEITVTSTREDVFPQYFVCFALFLFLFLVAGTRGLLGKTEGNGLLAWAVAGPLLVTLLLGMARVIGARIHTVIVTPREVRSIWGRWTWSIALSEIKEIRTYYLEMKGGGTSHGVLIAAQGWRLPIPLYLRYTPGSFDAFNAADAICERLSFVVDRFNTSRADEGPYR